MKPLMPLYCRSCRKKLLFFSIENGKVEVMCRITSCKAMNIVECKNGRCTFDAPVPFQPVVDNSFRVVVAESV